MPTITPTGLQSTHELARRRRIVAGLNGVTFLALLIPLATVLGAGGWTTVDWLMLACFFLAAPWTVLGFWNAAIGLWLLHVRRKGLHEAAPFASAGALGQPLRTRTAVLMTLRNEDPARAFRRLAIVKSSIEATGEGAHFSYFVLSDSDDPAVVAAEEANFAHWRERSDTPHRLFYRRRESNEGYKAGNLRDFCTRWGADYDFMLPLDADSLMSGEAVVRLVRIMQSYPRMGILQSLVVGLPAKSGFARLFQFGMRQGMRPYTVGSAWWGADCGPFWGHNALVRIDPFIRYCKLPTLPGKPPLGGPILSHDQVEAALMRRAGYEVRVLPVEGGSWEENPPTVLDFVRRDQRWCQGNMQYWRLLRLPGLQPMSRFQLAWAILMFVGIPAFTLLFALAAVKPFEAADLAGGYPGGRAAWIYFVFLAMSLAPKLAGCADVLLTPGSVSAYGGRGRFLAGVGAEILFSFLLGAISTFKTTVFMGGLLLGRSVTWNGQDRDAHALSWRTAADGLWAPTVFGVVVLGSLLAFAPAAAALGAPLIGGFLLAIPFAVWTADPRFEAWLTARGLGLIPEEVEVPPEVRAIASAPPAPAMREAA
ncbi:glucans biosynthesis glucosyltransferase MdoH [Alsobacter soli]|uniref:Glucans biosynthesis glucosyltransferase H n=1 Tax=Alsobacter soli TaxID=2109933 RepID=A0A2T1HLY8_9HYPH|nr:glucans biosynthesis glucosyltransferase MdoH [Alsobacter soli]PSC02670.1 glucans biosynthesis glucosyltransferase MdoH [Alsobacter soli]